MKIPKKLKVAGRVYSVELTPEVMALDGVQSYGQVRFSNSSMKLCTKIDGNTRNNASLCVSFLHEIIHAIDSAYGESDLTEEQIDSLAEGLYQVLKDNKLDFSEREKL